MAPKHPLLPPMAKCLMPAWYLVESIKQICALSRGSPCQHLHSKVQESPYVQPCLPNLFLHSWRISGR